MARVAFFIDGFNFYYSIKQKYPTYKWLSYRKLAERFIGPEDAVVGIFFFTAYPLKSPKKEARHKAYVRALESEGARIILGSYKERDRVCSHCGNTYKGYEEKLTDVNIAVKLLQEGVRDLYDIAWIVSGDNDLAPAVETFRDLFPAKKIGILLPIGKRGVYTKRLRKHANFHRNTKLRDLKASQFPPVVTLQDGSQVQCPSRWQGP